MSSLKKVVLAGATGNLGPAVLKGLVDGGFDVTVLTRDASKAPVVPSSVKVVPVDYTSLEALRTAVKGADAVVSNLATPQGAASQLLLVDAAVAEGVQRFLPSEFGCDYNKAGGLPIFADKIEVRRKLEQLSKTTDLSYTYVTTGPFLDWGIQVGFMLSINKPVVDLFDGGDKIWSSMTLAGIGRAVAGVLKHPEETKNRVVFVSEADVTQRQLLDIAQRLSGKTWETRALSSAQREQEAYAEMKKEKPDHAFWAMNQIWRAVYGEQYGGHFKAEQLDNELLGIKKLTDTELEDIVKSAL